MTRFVAALLCALVSACSPAPALARSTHHHARHHRARLYGGLPWCGIYLSQYFGLHDRRLWLARNWAFQGSAASGPGVGVVVVWPHHVGVITGFDGARGQWIVHSGNDGNAVRTRPRSLAGAIAFRRV